MDHFYDTMVANCLCLSILIKRLMKRHSKINSSNSNSYNSNKRVYNDFLNRKEEFKNTKENNRCSELKFVILENLNLKNITCLTIANLFGCYENVIQVILEKAESKALVEMETEIQAKTVCRYLDSIVFFGNQIKTLLFNSYMAGVQKSGRRYNKINGFENTNRTN